MIFIFIFISYYFYYNLIINKYFSFLDIDSSNSRYDKSSGLMHLSSSTSNGEISIYLFLLFGRQI